MISFVIPVFNEAESLVALHSAIDGVCATSALDFEVVFVDDGSTDGSWEIIQQLCTLRPATHGIRFRRNFGKAAALSAGFHEATGDVVITMDADLQDDPAEVPRMMAKLDDGFDVVSGWKKVRHDPWHKRYPSKVFNALVSRLTGVKLNDHNCGFKAYRREVTEEVQLYGERHRFVPVLAAAQGYRIGEIEVTHHARKFGHSKYGVSRLVKGFLDLVTIYLITGYGGRPLHLIGAAGLVSFAFGAIGMLYLSARWVLSRLVESWDVLHLHETAIFYYCILAVIVGSQCLLAGLLAELFVSRTQRATAVYRISERTGIADDAAAAADKPTLETRGAAGDQA
ncbi:MAG: glycosyltransferase family 2 protein [Planctomycetota bacterium]